MTAKDLFTIILKIFGIYLIKDVIVSIPPVIQFSLQIREYDENMAFFSFLVSLLTLGFYILIVYFLLFRTAFLIRKLNLTSDLSEAPLMVSMHRSTIYKIAIIISGIVILAFSVPDLIRQLYLWYQFVDTDSIYSTLGSFDFTPLIVSATEVVIGLLFLGNQNLIINFIELNRRKSTSDQAWNDEMQDDNRTSTE